MGPVSFEHALEIGEVDVREGMADRKFFGGKQLGHLLLVGLINHAVSWLEVEAHDAEDVLQTLYEG